MINLPADEPTRTGYTFGGWTQTKDGNDTVDANTAYATNTTLYAKWTPIQYNVSFGTYDGSYDEAFDSSKFAPAGSQTFAYDIPQNLTSYTTMFGTDYINANHIKGL